MNLPGPNSAAAHLLRAINDNDGEYFPAPADISAVVAAADELSKFRGWRVDTSFRSSKGYLGAVPSNFGHIGFRIEQPAGWREFADRLNASTTA
jgi:hypothetical protein